MTDVSDSVDLFQPSMKIIVLGMCPVLPIKANILLPLMMVTQKHLTFIMKDEVYLIR